jgi:hypothetical protein
MQTGAANRSRFDMRWFFKELMNKGACAGRRFSCWVASCSQEIGSAAFQEGATFGREPILRVRKSASAVACART